MRIGRKAIAAMIASATLVPALANIGGSPAVAAGWKIFKLGGSGGGSEPGLDAGLDANGNPVVYAHGTFGIPSHNKMWRLDNDTTGFTPITFSTPYNRFPGGGDAETAMRGDDVWFIDLWAGSNSIQYSPDKGKTWVSGTPFTTLPLSDRQWIEVGPTRTNPVTGARETTIYATYQFIQPGLGTWLARSRDNGVTWDMHSAIQEGRGPGTNGIPIDVVSDGNNTVAVAMISGGQMRVAVSRDAGETWDVNSVSGAAKDAAGTLTGFTMNPRNANEMAVSYLASHGAMDAGVNNKTVVRITRDGGATWGDMIRLDPAADPLGNMDWFPWIDWVGNKIAVAWYQSNAYVPGRDSNDGTTTNSWSVWYSESVDGGLSFSAPESIGTGAVKKGGICTQGLACTADRELGDFLNVAIDHAGRSLVTFVNASNSGALPGNAIYVFRQN